VSCSGQQTPTLGHLRQQKLALAGLQVVAKFLADFAAVGSGEGSQSLSGRRIAVGKMVLTAQEDGNGNQPQDFLVAGLAARKIGGKSVAIFGGILHQYSCLPDEIIPDFLACHINSKTPEAIIHHHVQVMKKISHGLAATDNNAGKSHSFLKRPKPDES
jgi:hypothetical protein